MRSRKERLYWDANCFIALFNQEPTTDAKYLAALEATYVDMLDEKLFVVTSDVLRGEVFGSDLTEEYRSVYENLLGCRNFDVIPVRTPDWERAAKLRQLCRDNSMSLKLPDALHVVMGQLASADEIWTTDKGLITKGAKGLLGTTNILYPHVDQMRLPYGVHGL